MTLALFPVWKNGLTPELIKKAEKELGETEEVKTQALRDLRRLIQSEKDFRPRTDDAFLLRFLRCKKFKPEIAFNTLRNYYTFKYCYSGVFTDFTPSQVKHILEMDMFCTLPGRLSDGSCVVVFRPGNFDINMGTREEFLATSLIILEVTVDVEANQVCGGSAIYDMDKFGLRHFKYFSSPTLLYRMVKIIQDCTPVRLKRFHVVNESKFFTILFTMVKPFLTEKIKSRFHFHGRNLESLHKIFPPEILPNELGGTAGHIDNTDYRNMILNREDHFVKMSKYGFQKMSEEFTKKESSMDRGLFLSRHYSFENH